MTTTSAPAATAPASWPQRVLLEDEQIRIDHFCAPRRSRTLVITFDPLLFLAQRPHFGQDFLRRLGVDIVAVRKKTENFYQPLARAAFVDAVGPLLQRYQRVVAYGSSLGAYAALYFCRDLDCEVIASSPRVSVHPRYGSKVWQRQVAFRHEPFDPRAAVRCRAIVVYDPKEPLDRRFMEGEVLPQFSRALVLRVPYSGHPSNHFLSEIGFIAPFVRAVIAGTAHPPLDRRQRVRSATYFQVVAALCAQRGKLRWADALIERSLALNARNMLAHRTLGQIRLHQRRWVDAAAALEAALALSPDDPLTRTLLAQAREASARPPGDGPPAGRPGQRSRALKERLRSWVRRR
jgi:tetratricopeptide (TPR) repeat protein